jgi:hypothetical protein
MAEEDKLHCGQQDRNPFIGEDDPRMEDVMQKFAVTKEDVLDVMLIVGNNYEAITNYFHDKQNAY